MDGEQGAATEKGRVGGETGAQVGRHESGLPVVAVEDVGAKEEAGHGEGGAAEDGKSNVVVRVIQAGFAVEAFPVVEERAIHEVHGVFGRGLIDRIGVGIGAEIHCQVVPDAPEVFQFDGLVARDHHGDFIAVRSQCQGKGAHDIGETASFGERRRLGGDHQDTGHVRDCIRRSVVAEIGTSTRRRRERGDKRRENQRQERARRQRRVDWAFGLSGVGFRSRERLDQAGAALFNRR